jgi:cytochrome c
MLYCWLLGLAAATALAASARAQGGATRSVWAGVYTSEQAKRGEPLYAQSCGACHGGSLEGGEMAPPLTGGPFNANWNGLTMGDLFERLRISMPQNSPGSLPRQAYVDILAFMLRTGDFPEGKAELPRETELLKQITFDATKP